MKKKSVCIIGLGFVGLTLSTVMANRGFKIFGVEKNKLILNNLKQKKGHFYEPGLNSDLLKNFNNNSFSYYKKIPNDKSITTYIVTVGTPLNSKNKIKVEDIVKCTKEIAKVLKNNDTVILRSTVRIGTTRNIVYPILKASDKHFFLSYCPERAVEGSALKELCVLPQVIGGIDKKSEIISKNIFKKITKKIVMISNVETAEMIKLIDNSSRDVFFAYANEIARACDAIGLDASEVINSGKKYYHRTGLAKPGLVGGPCLHKDPYIFSQSAKKFGVSAEITLMARKINERQPFEAIDFLYKLIKKNKSFSKKLKISLVGLAFKGYPVTDDLRGSMSIKVLKEIKKKFRLSKYYGYDPVVTSSNINKIGLISSNSLENAFKNKDMVLILNNHHIFSEMPIEKLSKKLTKPAIIYDFWNHFGHKKLKLPNLVKYISLGSHNKIKQ